MGLDELLITTGVDALVRLIKEKGMIELSLAAQLLNIDAVTIEDWAHTLEEEGIIKIEYHLTKVYLAWVQPSAEEIEKEKISITKGKQEVMQEIAILREKIAPQGKELRDLKTEFSEVYKKLKPEMERLGKSFKDISATREKGGEKLIKHLENLDNLRAETNGLQSGINDLKKQISELSEQFKEKSSAEPRIVSIKKMQASFEELGTDLASVRKTVTSLAKTSQKPPVQHDEMKKLAASINEQLAALKKSIAETRGYATTIKDGVELVALTDQAFKERSDRILQAKKDAESLLTTFEELKVRSTLLSEKMHEDAEALSQLSESVSFAHGKGAGKQISPSDLDKKLVAMEETEAKLAAKLAALEQAMSYVPKEGGVSKEEVEELLKTLDEKKKILSGEIAELFSAVEEESGTYTTFQKIKERALSSLEEYSTKLEKLSTSIKSISEETGKIEKEAESSFEKLKGTVGVKEVEGILSSEEKLVEKQHLLDDMAESIDALITEADNVSKHLSLLAKEAELVSLRESGVAPPSSLSSTGGKVPTQDELVTNLSLTNNEQKDFEKKREELRNLIKKLWEEG